MITELIKGLVMIVEDDKDIRETMAKFLANMGYTTISAGNGLEALSTLLDRKNIPCVVILDLMMPKMNGWEFRQEQLLRSDIANVPVILVSAIGNLHVERERLGAVDYLQKPFSLHQLHNVVQKYC
jgi:CheY-like chemotaxis protein